MHEPLCVCSTTNVKWSFSAFQWCHTSCLVIQGSVVNVIQPSFSEDLICQRHLHSDFLWAKRQWLQQSCLCCSCSVDQTKLSGQSLNCISIPDIQYLHGQYIICIKYSVFNLILLMKKANFNSKVGVITNSLIN